jgi:hypothetical protein
MDWATFWAILLQTHLVTLVQTSTADRVTGCFCEEVAPRTAENRPKCFPAPVLLNLIVYFSAYEKHRNVFKMIN